MAIIERDGCKYADDETLRELLEYWDDEGTFSYEMSDAELVRGMTEMSREHEVETIIAPHGLVGDRIES